MLETKITQIKNLLSQDIGNANNYQDVLSEYALHLQKKYNDINYKIDININSLNELNKLFFF